MSSRRPLFGPSHPDDPEGSTLANLLELELARASLEGEPEPSMGGGRTLRLTLDVDLRTVDTIGALANAFGTSRRNLATRLIGVATWEFLGLLESAARSGEVEAEAALTTFGAASAALRKRRAREEAERAESE